MLFSQRFQISWNDSVANFTQDLGWYMISLAVAFGAIIASWIIIYLGDRCLNRKKSSLSKPWESFNQINKVSPRRSYARLIIVLLAIIILVGGFWIAFAFAGVSFWNVILGYGIVTLIATYAFGPAIQAAGAYLLISMTNKIHEDDWIELVGMPVEGRVLAINIMWTELEYIDVKGDTTSLRAMQVPTNLFISNIIRRNFSREVPSAPTMAASGRINNKLLGGKSFNF